jgi:hypothetical protein
MQKFFQKIIRIANPFLLFLHPPPTLPMFISPKDKRNDSEFEKFKQDLIDTLLLLAIVTFPFLLLGLLMVGLALCLSR